MEEVMMNNKGYLENTRTVARNGHPEGSQVVGSDFSLLLALSKKDSYEVTCLNFKKKYGMEYSDFVRMVERKKNQGEFDISYFEMRDDQMDWEFAEAARRWWKVKIEKTATIF